MALPEGFLEDLKFRNPIEDVISSYVTLKRAGSNLVGLCPFHNEKSPSFTVFPATRGFYCFGCGAGGDAITFVMKAENLDYIGAVEHLCKRAGIDMPQDDRAKRHGDDDVKKRVCLPQTAMPRGFTMICSQSPRARRDLLICVPADCRML